MCHVLIAASPDDSQFIKEIIATYFFNIILKPDASSIETIKDSMAKNQIEILILDISEDPEGYLEFAQEFNKEIPAAKIIILAQEANFHHLQKAMRLHVSDYILKPLNKSDCQLALHQAIVALNQISLLNYEAAETTDVLKQAAHQMMCYIHDHFHQEIDLDSLARHVHLNPTYLSRFFRQTVGISFSQYLRKYRINQAQRLLKQSDLSIVEVGCGIGYSEPTHFSRVFKQETGMTPSQYRNSIYEKTS